MKKIGYSEPKEYIPEELRKKYKIGEFAEDEKEKENKPDKEQDNEDNKKG